MGIKQGDQYLIPISITSDGEPLDIENVEIVEIALGNLIKKYPTEISYDSEEEIFMFPVLQTETFAFRSGLIKMDVRVKFTNGTVIGLPQIQTIPVPSALSGEVL